MSDNVRIVPASCTQCGGTVEVDPQTDKALCPFCGTAFIVEKAVNYYNVQHADIEHADNVNIDMTGSVKAVLEFAGEQMKESREERRQARKEAAETQRMVNRGFLRIFGIMCGCMMIFAVISFIYFQITGSDSSDADLYEAVFSEDKTVSCYIEEGGMISVNITDSGMSTWQYEPEFSTERLRSEESDFDGFHFYIKPSHENGIGYAVVAEFDEEASAYPTSYGIAEFVIDKGEVSTITYVAHVTDLSDYSFQK